MPDIVRSVSVTRALVVAAWCSGVALSAGAQSAPATESRSASTLVVVLPSGGDSVASARIAKAIAGHNVVAVYTTDTRAVYAAAEALHVRFGGSLIPYDRLSRPAKAFADLLFDNAVDHAAQKHPGQAILVVADADLTLPFLRRAASQRTSGDEPDIRASDSFVIAIGSDGALSVTRVPFY